MRRLLPKCDNGPPKYNDVIPLIYNTVIKIEKKKVCQSKKGESGYENHRLHHKAPGISRENYLKMR